MPFLEIRRDSGYADHIRAYNVELDGITIGKLKDGEIKQFAVLPGPHRLRMKVDWCGSKTAYFTAIEKEKTVFYVKSGLRGAKVFASAWFALFEQDSWIVLTQDNSEPMQTTNEYPMRAV